MSLEIEDRDNLSEREVRYLADRAKLTKEEEAHYGVKPNPGGGPVIIEGSSEDEENGDDSEGKSLDKMTVAELQEQIDLRNEELDEENKLSRSGTKQELLDRIVEFDEQDEE